MAGVGHAGLFDDGEGVHVSAYGEGWAGAVLEDGDDAVGLRSIRIDADMIGHGIAGLAQFGGEEGCGAVFKVGELGMRVEVLVGIDQTGKLLLFEGGDILCDE